MPISLAGPGVLAPTGVGIDQLVGSGSFNGLTWGPGTDFHIAKIAGVSDLPSIRTDDVGRGFDHGAWSGNDWMDGRTFTLDILVTAANNAALYADLLLLESAFQPAQAVSPLLLFGSARRINCRCRSRKVPYDAGHAMRQTTATLEMYAPDPRIYDAATQLLSTGLQAAGGGVAWPITWPASWGPAGTGGTLTVVNTGNFPTRPILTIYGPVDNPTIENLTSGQHLTFNPLSLIGTDTLTVDLDTGAVVVNGTASRRASLTSDSQWWEIAPGTSTIRYRANTTQTGSSLSLSFAPAYL